MIRTITTPFVDTRADDLVLSLGEPVLPAVATHTIRLEGGPLEGGRVDGAQVELRLLKASHQVVVRRDGRALIETLACLPGSPAPLPSRHETRCDLGDYRTTVRVVELTDDELEATVSRLLRRHGDDRRYLIGRFPGHPLATTGIGVADIARARVSWRSWHAYPQEGRVVLTDSTLRLHTAGRQPAGAGRGGGVPAAGRAAVVAG